MRPIRLLRPRAERRPKTPGSGTLPPPPTPASSTPEPESAGARPRSARPERPEACSFCLAPYTLSFRVASEHRFHGLHRSFRLTRVSVDVRKLTQPEAAERPEPTGSVSKIVAVPTAEAGPAAAAAAASPAPALPRPSTGELRRVDVLANIVTGTAYLSILTIVLKMVMHYYGPLGPIQEIVQAITE